MAKDKNKPGINNLLENNRELDEEVLVQIALAIKQLKYGTVTIVVQDSKVVQIEKTEKMRLS